MNKNKKRNIILFAVVFFFAFAFAVYIVNPKYRFYFSFKANSEKLYTISKPFLENDKLVFSEDMYNPFVRKPLVIKHLYGGIFLEYFDSEKNSLLFNLLNSPYNFMLPYKEGFIITSDLSNIPKSDGTKIYITPITNNVAYVRFAYKQLSAHVTTREQMKMQ